MIDFSGLLNKLKGISVERPNKQGNGSLSGHAAGEPFEKAAYRILKLTYPSQVFKQFEFLNDIYLKIQNAFRSPNETPLSSLRQYCFF